MTAASESGTVDGLRDLQYLHRVSRGCSYVVKKLNYILHLQKIKVKILNSVF